MECFIVEKENIDLEQHSLVLIEDEAHHAMRSLRIKSGEEILVTDLAGTCYLCRVERADPGTLNCLIEEILPNFGEPKTRYSPHSGHDRAAISLGVFTRKSD